MNIDFRSIAKYRYLICQLVLRDIKVRYKNSVLGFFWSLANPLIQVATITVVVKYIMRVDIPNYSAYLLAAFLPWQFVLNGLADSSEVLLHHRDLIKKVPFPREVLPISNVLSNLVHFLLALCILFVYLLVFWLFMKGSPIGAGFLWLPVLIVLQSCLILGLAFVICTINAFFDDTKFILNALLNIGFYLTPVMYPVELVYSKLSEAGCGWLYRVYMLSPFNTLMDAYKKLLMPPFEGSVAGSKVTSLPVDWAMFGICAVICIAVLLAGMSFFNRRKHLFAERL